MAKESGLDLEKFIAVEVSGLGFKFVKLEFNVSRENKILRIYADKVGGITVDDCGKINYHLNKVLSVSNYKKLNDYILEVSSPGINYTA